MAFSFKRLFPQNTLSGFPLLDLTEFMKPIFPNQTHFSSRETLMLAVNTVICVFNYIFYVGFRYYFF